MMPSIGMAPSLPPIARTSRPVSQVEPDPVPEREGSAVRGNKGALDHAHALADDATALAASFMQRRAGRGDGNHGGTVEDWAERLLDPGAKDGLGQLRQLVLGQKAGPTEIQAALARLFPDASDAYAALRALLADHELASLRAQLEEALEQLVARCGAEVKAGANVANAARAAAARKRGKRRLTSAALRASYRSLLGSDEALELYAAWLDVFGEDERHLLIEFLTDALVADMCCSDPSGSAIQFGRMLRSARLLSCLRTLDRRFCTDPLLLSLVGRENLQHALRPMLYALTDPAKACDWVGAFLDQFARENDARAGLQLCMALRRFIKSINSPEVLPPECRIALLDCVDQRNRTLLDVVRPSTLLLDL